MSDLPNGWTSCTIGEALESTIGGVWGAAPGDADIDVDVIRVTELKSFGRLEPATAARRSVTTSQLSSRSLQPGDLLLEKSGGGPNTPVGRVGLVAQVDRPTVCSNFMQLMRPNRDLLTPRFLMWHLVNAHLGGVTASLQTATTNIRNLKMKDYWAVRLGVPPLSEQERIVTAIEEAFSKLDAGEVGLRTARRLLKRMRAAVLAAAVTGRLVPQDPTDSPSSQLMAGLGVQPLNDPGLPVLPTSWLWTQVQDVGQVDLGRQRSPKYHSGDNMKPYLRVANVFEDRIDTSDVMEMHFAPEAFERSRLAVGDILLNEGQTPELLGRPAMYRGEPPDVAFTNSLLRFKAGPGIESEWALLVFRQHMHSGRFTRESRITTNIAHLSAARFKPVEFPVPPIEEQRRVVQESDRLASVVAACERAVDAGLARSAALRRSVLKAAFEGRLVPKDSSDEPASVLLERIQAEGPASDGLSGGRRRKNLEAS